MNPIVEKIKKLLRMKRGGTPDEIATALAMAAELARKHGIDLSSVDPDAPEAKPISHIDAKTAARLQDECRYAALVCQHFFNVTALITDAPSKSFRRWRDFKIIFIGTDTDQQIALYVFEFLCGHFRRAWIRRPNKRLRDRSAFLNGMFQGLCSKLDSQRAQQVSGEGLMRLDQQVVRRSQYMAENFGETKSTSIKSSDSQAALYAGWVEGKKTEILSGLEDGSEGVAVLPAGARMLLA